MEDEIFSSSENGLTQSLYQKKMRSYLEGMQTQLDQQEKTINTANKINTGLGIAKTAAGILGFFNEPNQVDKHLKETYVEDPALKAAANIALSKAFSNSNDYAARIRTRNARIKQIMDAVGNSGGDRNFVAANEAAAMDVENQTNLAIDKQLEDEKNAKVQTAAGLEQMALYDRLNSSADKFRVAEANVGIDKFNIEQKRANTLGAAGLLSSGLNDITTGFATKNAEKATTNLMRLKIADTLSKYFIKPEDEIPQEERNTNIKNFEQRSYKPIITLDYNERNA